MPKKNTIHPSTLPALGHHELFTPWRDERSGITSYRLKKIAPVQQSFYFTNRSVSADGRYLWFYCAFPPAGNDNYGRMLGVADLWEKEIRYFPETQFLDASPMVDPTTGEVFWASGVAIFKRGPGVSDQSKLVNRLPSEWVKNRRPHRIATHLTMSADRAALAFDAQIGNEWFVGDVPLNGSPPRLWERFSRCYNHAQFSPIDPDMILVGQDWWHDPSAGERFEAEDRLWIIKRGEKARPLCPDAPSSNRSHEWWDCSGEWVWYVDYEKGTARVNIHTGEVRFVWPAGTCHSHCDASGRFLVGDIGTYNWANQGCSVSFFSTDTGRQVDIASSLAEPSTESRSYHLHPHPQFCLDDRLICYTNTSDKSSTLAFVYVEELAACTT